MLKRMIETFMTETPHTVGSDQPLQIAHDLMQRYSVRHLPVLKAGKLVGIVSERDLHLVETLAHVDPSEVTVDEAMTMDVYVVSTATPLHEVAATMSHHKYGSAVVVNGSHVVGVFTTTDALRALADLAQDHDQREGAVG